jgi:hypothetical protein
MNKKGKTIGYIVLTILELLLVFCYILTVQFGWNQILTTIVPVNVLSLAQAFGLALVTELLFKGVSKPKTDTDKEDYLEEKFKYVITQFLNLGFVYFMMWIVTFFI